MESAAGDQSLSPSTNGLKKVFSKPNRSRTTLSDLETSSRASDQPSTGSNQEKRPSTGSENAHDGAPTGIAKLMQSSRRRRRKKREAETAAAQDAGLDNEDRNNDANDSDRSSASKAHRRSKTDPGGRSRDDSDSEGYSPINLRPSREPSPNPSSPLVKSESVEVAESEPKQDIESAEASTTASDDRSLRHGTTLIVADPSSASSHKGHNSAGRRLREAFNPRATNKSPSTSPDRESAKSAGSKGSKGSKGLWSSGRRRSSLSRKGAKPPEDIPPVPAPIIIPPQSSEVSRAPHTSLPPLDTRPQTPPVEPPAPMTTVTPPTPTSQRSHSPALPQTKIVESPEPIDSKPPLPPNVVVSPSGNMISHRRVRSASAAHNPSKLSNSMTAPLTPTLEEPKSSKTGGGNTIGAGFFSSMFSAAQNAASTFSSSLNTQSRSRTSSDPVEIEKQTGEGREMEDFPGEKQDADSDQKKELAIDTLGTGDLDFSHLGIDATQGGVITTKDGVVFTKLDANNHPRRGTTSQRDEQAARIEDMRAARAVSMAYERPAPGDGTGISWANPEGNQPDTRPAASVTGLGKGSTGEQTPPGGSIFEGEVGGSAKRSNSVRSRLRRRHRGSSGATTGTAIGALGAAGIGLGLPGANSSTPRLTGFAVASKKRNREFHQLFRSVPEDDYLIEDYSCALQREIILAGRIYISEGHICFSSNILGWVTTLVISFDEIMAIEKESTAMVFPNAIAIQTLHARHTFRSLLSREATYDLMVNIWKINHPTLKSSINGTQIDQGTGDKTEKADVSEVGSDSISTDEDEVYDEDEDTIISGFQGAGDGSVTGSDRSALSNRICGKSSAPLVSASLSTPALPNEAKLSEKQNAVSIEDAAQYPGPATHPPTDFTDPSGRYEKLIKDEIIPAPLGRVYSLVFGPASGGFITKFLLEFQKVTELQFEDDKKGLNNDNRTRTYNYIKPLNASIGPKQTKCISIENLDFFDLEKAVLVTLTTQTPDVPSGNLFSTKTKYLFTWAPNNSTRFHMSCMIEWTGKSWLKAPIEKGANDGQLTFGTDLVSALKTAVAPRSRSATNLSKAAKNSKGKRKRANTAVADGAAGAQAALEASKRQAANWGVLEPLRGPLSPVVDIFKPLWSGNIALAIIFILLFTLWFRAPPQRQLGDNSLLSVPERLAAYEEMWRREESDLWDWLEARVGLDGLAYPVADTMKRSGSSKSKNGFQQPLHSERVFEERLRNEGMSEREMEDAIRVTQQRLDVLQNVINKRKQQRRNAQDASSAPIHD